MTLPNALSPEHLAELRGDDAEAVPEPAAPAEPTGVGARGKRLARRLVERLVRSQTGPLSARIEELHAQLGALRPAVDLVHDLQSAVRGLEAELVSWTSDAAHGVSGRLEQLKGELRDLGAELDRLGRAIAPAAGLEGAGQRFAELRVQLNGLDERLRLLEQGAPLPSAPEERGDTPESPPFDYVGFERRFRGDPDEITRLLADRYVPLLDGHGPVLDVGCGRGELVEALSAAGVEAYGVDLEPGMVAAGRASGRDVRLDDAVAHLEGLPEQSLGAVVAIHVLEHLPLPVLLALLDLARSRLRPGGLLVAETPNPASLIVLGNSYILDPTHVWPLHPSLMVFLCERAGFADVELRFFSPASGYHLPSIPADEQGAWAGPLRQGFQQLNDVLFGPQDYAVVARTLSPVGISRLK